jgi:hypothetical protein
MVHTTSDEFSGGDDVCATSLIQRTLADCVNSPLRALYPMPRCAAVFDRAYRTIFVCGFLPNQVIPKMNSFGGVLSGSEL